MQRGAIKEREYDDLRSQFWRALPAEGLIWLTGDENVPLAHALAKDGMAGRRQLLRQLISIVGSQNVYVELQRHADRFQESRKQAALS